MNPHIYPIQIHPENSSTPTLGMKCPKIFLSSIFIHYATSCCYNPRKRLGCLKKEEREEEKEK
jgi:hypothetical protein